jgi:hypothetical protein
MKLLKILSSKIALTILLFFSVSTTVVLSITLRHYKKEAKQIPVNRELLLQKMFQAPPEWMMARIKTDFAPFSEKGITHAMIDDVFQGERIGKYSLVRFTIKQRHLSFSIDEKQLDGRHFRHLLASMKKLNELVELPDVDFVVSLEDGFDANPEGFPNVPCLVFAKSERAQNFVLMPDFKAFAGYGKLRRQILDGNRKFPWEKKRAQGFWRGSTTSGFFQKDNWDQFCRGKLVLFSLLHPNEVDARFTGVVQCTPEVPALMESRGMLSNLVGKVDHLNYKYLIDVDGNSCTYERCFWVLLSNSLVLKQITPNVQWYYGGLKPYVHYLPLQEDLTDLAEKIHWAKEHDEEARLMAERSTEFVKENLSAESIFQYMALLLTEYAKLQQRTFEAIASFDQ